MEKELASVKKVKGYKNDSNMKAKDWKAVIRKIFKNSKKRVWGSFSRRPLRTALWSCCCCL